MPVKNLTSFAFSASSQSRVRSSPTRIRIALTKAMNEAFVGGTPILPRQRGLVYPQIDVGSSDARRASVL